MSLNIWGRTLLFLGALSLGCENRNSASVPSAEDVALRLPDFYFKSLPINALYVDHDADGIIFRYLVAQDERPVLLTRISDAARANGWKVVYEGQSGTVRSLHLRRTDDPKHRVDELHSLEIVRITSCGSALLIGGIQVDVKEQSGLAEVSADGPRWYQTTFWPLVARYRAEACGPEAVSKTESKSLGP